MEIFSLPFYFRRLRPRCERASWRLDEFQCLVFTVSVRNRDWAKLFASVEGRNSHGAKITQYSVIYQLNAFEIFFWTRVLSSTGLQRESSGSVGRSFKDHKILVGIGTMKFTID